MKSISIKALLPKVEVSSTESSHLPTTYAVLNVIQNHLESLLQTSLFEEETYVPYSLFDLHRASQVTFSTLDHFHFGECWESIRELPQETLLALIQKRREEIWQQREYWKEKILSFESEELLKQAIHCLAQGNLVRCDEGAGAAYFLFDEDNCPRFVIKPCDEEIYCLNNCKGYGSPFADSSHWVRENIPLYRSAQTDCLAYKVAKLIGCESITAKTSLSILTSDAFHDCSGILSPENKKEKLCSVQEYLVGTHSFTEILYEWMHEGCSDEEIMDRIDQDDFEDANIFIWTTFDNDAHSANLRSYVKKMSSEGKEIYGLKKIDNSLSFPEKNTGMYNFLIALPNSQKTLSDRAKNRIAAIPVAEIVSEMTALELESSIPAFLERITLLQALAQQDRLTIEEINYTLKLLEKNDEEE